MTSYTAEIAVGAIVVLSLIMMLDDAGGPIGSNIKDEPVTPPPPPEPPQVAPDEPEQHHEDRISVGC